MSDEKKGKLAVLLVRGTIGAKQGVKDTLKMLNLNKTNSLAVLEDTPVNHGMITKVKDYVTFGVISDEVLKKLEAKSSGSPYHLSPPRGGFEAGGIKKPFAKKGVLGFRGPKINDLIEKMI